MKTHRLVTLALGTALGTAACSSDAGPGDGKTYVLVHGAWMSSQGWDTVAGKLRDSGAEVRTLDLPAHGADSTPANTATLAGYVDRVGVELDAGPAIVVGHSMAGIVISQLAEQRPADITRLVYLAAYVPTSGQSLFDLAMADADSQIGPSLQFGNDGTVGVAADAFPDLFCADCDPVARQQLIDAYQPEPMAPLGTPVTLGDNFASVPKTYLHTTLDLVVSPSLQTQMTRATAFDRELDLPASHAAMLSHPDELVDALLAE